MIRFIMWMTKGPTDPDTNIEFTDWNQVEEFGRVVSEM
jgi:menaquinone-dependent protoporphyrinogen oxidase